MTRFTGFWRPSNLQRLFKTLPLSTRRRVLRYSLLTVNIAVLVVVAAFVVQGRHGNSSQVPIQGAASLGEAAPVVNPLDQLSSADIAVHIARVANLDEAQAVANKADTVNAQQTVSSTSQSVVNKPQVVTDGLKSRKDIQKYTVQAGETVSSIAAKFGVTSDTIRWSNGLTGDAVAAGKVLLISPINGIVYQVKGGDTVDSVAGKYHANRDLLVAINDAELGALPVGEYIIIPGGSPAATTGGGVGTLANITAGGNFAWGGYGAVYSGNGYDYGYCTWWAANRRAQIGRPIPSNLGNASTWKVLAQRSGLGVGNAPAAGAVIWFPPRDFYGHVGFVESVNGDGSVNISEMNVGGWARVDYRTIPASEAGNYSYIY